MRLLIGITTLSRQNQESSKHIKNEIKIQQTREIRIEKIRTEKAEQKKLDRKEQKEGADMQQEINNNFSKEDEFYMKRAIELAKRGTGWVNPNPLVGAVIVKDDRIIGEGWHRKYGELHAERDALSRCMEDTRGATIYVTLEPCCHHGKQPPCTEALVQAGISRVVIGSMDPNPLVSGKGVKYLEEHGIKVEGCVCNEECLAMNYVFFYYIRNKEPYVVMKTAQTLDGKIATYNGLSKWITGEQARENVHADRHRYAAIMVGVGTVIADNPMLDCRSTAVSNPHKSCANHMRQQIENSVGQQNCKKVQGRYQQ